MSAIQLSAGSESNDKERKPLLAVPADQSGQVRASLIIPTLNEAQNLGHVLPALPDTVDQLVIVDGGSTDGTLEVIRNCVPTRESSRRRGEARALPFRGASSPQQATSS